MATRSFSISAGPTPTASQDVSFRKKGRAGGRPSYGDEVGPALDGRRETILKKRKIMVNRNRNWTGRFLKNFSLPVGFGFDLSNKMGQRVYPHKEQGAHPVQ